MAAPRTEIDIVGEGAKLLDPYNNQAFYQNLYKQRGLWETREGFGTLVEFTGMLNAMDINASTGLAKSQNYGLDKHLGSFLFETNFGHEQVISVFRGYGYTGYLKEEDDINQDDAVRHKLTDIIYFYQVFIYDTHTNNLWMETIYQHTGELNEPDQVSPFYHGYYESRYTSSNFSQTVQAEDDYFFFKSYLGKLYFANKSGLYVYNPAAFIENRTKLVNNVNNRNELNDTLSNHYSEGSLIDRVAFKDGIFATDNAFSYIQTDELKSFTAIDAYQGRLVIASGKSIYFTDVGVPNAIIGDNVFTFHEMRNPITAIKVLTNGIVIWSKDQTFFYQPSRGVLLSGGRSVLAHDEIGCVGQNAVLHKEGNVFWVDKNGVYVTTNGLNLQELSLPIKKFFQDETVSPLVHYFTANGLNFDGSADKPPFILRAEENLDGVHLSYDEKHETLFVVFPKLNLAWGFKEGWFLWLMSSIVFNDSGDQQVGTTAAVTEPWFVSGQREVYALGGRKTTTMNKTDWDTGSDELTQTTLSPLVSFRLFEWGRGGALDGSTRDYNEGKRLSGYYRKVKEQTPGSGRYSVYFDKLRRFGNRVSAEATQTTVYGQEDDLYYLPIRITPFSDLSRRVQNLTLSFYIDTTRWTIPSWDGAVDNSAIFMLPPETAIAYDGFSPGAGVATSEFSFDGTTGEVTIKFDVSLATSSYNFLNLSNGNKNDFIYIPLQKRSAATDPSQNIITEWGSFQIDHDDGAGGQTRESGLVAYEWLNGWFPARTAEEVQAPIDWVLKSQQIGMEDANQIKARGSYSLISSRGEGQKFISPWNFGVWNSLAGSDYKDYVSQNVDFVGEAAVREDFAQVSNKNSIRTRWLDGTDLKNRTFNNSATYSSNQNVDDGNFYVDVPEVDTIATSDSVRGESVSYTFFGFLQDKANKIVIRTIKVALQAVAGRRRRGR